MTAPEIEWVLNRLADVVESVQTDYGATLIRIDRDNSRFYEGTGTIDMTEPLHKRTGELETGCYVGARSTAVGQSPIGTEYNLDIESTVGLRLEGLVASEYGHVDPDGDDGVPWPVLKRRVRNGLYNQRTWPDASKEGITFTHLSLTNEADTSSDWRDFYRWDVDILFDGFETLP